MNEVRTILEATIYCNIATVCDDGSPWNTPVFFGYDDELNIYWRSWTESVHSQNLAKRPNAFITIYNSQVPWGEGKGVYLQGGVVELNELADVQQALRFLDRRSSKKFPPEDFMDENPRRLYKFSPVRVWRNIDSEVRGKFIDTRREIAL